MEVTRTLKSRKFSEIIHNKHARYLEIDFGVVLQDDRSMEVVAKISGEPIIEVLETKNDLSPSDYQDIQDHIIEQVRRFIKESNKNDVDKLLSGGKVGIKYVIPEREDE